MKKLCFIIPYFGKLPNYFPLFLKSCKYNPEFNWIIFTDDNRNFEYPSNVQKINMDFGNCKSLIQSKFEIKIDLPKPYKLCDLKPMYGYIFNDYIKDYLYWGYCDIDIILGNLGKYLTTDILTKYDKMFCLGHMTIFRNTPKQNQLFMSPILGKDIYKEILATPTICWFDEEWNNNYNINKIFEQQKQRIYTEDLSFNVSVSYNHFRRTQYIGKKDAPPYGFKIESEKKALYIWEEGNLYRLYFKNNKIKREDFLYMHLQKRKMHFDSSVLLMKKFKIVPDEFLPIEVDNINPSNFNKIKKYGHCNHVQRIFLNRIIIKLKKFFAL